MRALDIAAALSAQVETVVRHLLPNGRRVGQEWRVGGIEGEAGKSMGVHMTGEKAGGTEPATITVPLTGFPQAFDRAVALSG